MIFKLANSQYPNIEIDVEMTNDQCGCKFNFRTVDEKNNFIFDDKELVDHLKEFSKNVLNYMSQILIQNEAHSNLTPFIFLSEEFGFPSNFEFNRI
ncbi:MAG: hypothetical protein KC589_06150 [Nanoarchaeota archaeon]|nr:hypothetical protein [Nanoarchaeota archaeon]